MRPQNSPSAVLFETHEEVEVLRSYMSDNQPEAFSDEALAARRELLLVSVCLSVCAIPDPS